MSKVTSYPAYQNSVIEKISLRAVFEIEALKAEIKGVLAGHSVAMVTYSTTKIIPTCSPVIGQFFDTMIITSIDKEWL